MLKREELAILDRAIAELGAQSYLGPWLQSVRAEVFQSITSDLEPAMLPAEAYARAADMIARARTAAAEIDEDARRKATGLLENTQKRVDDYRRRARLALERIAGEI